jgi:hypothetical protein
MRMLAWTFAFAAAFILAFVPIGRHRPLDPDEPLAVDGSMTAGRARTIFQFERVLGAFDEPKPPPDPDDPQNFRPYLDIQRPWMDNRREAVRGFFFAVPDSLCENATRRALIAAIQFYYEGRGGQKASFVRRGANASAFIEEVWATDVDRQIDAFVRNLLIAGYLPESDLRRGNYPEFAKVVAGAKKAGTACAR